MRVPVTISNRSRIWSRSRKQYQNIEIAPSSSAAVASQTRCEWIRFSSARHIRIQVAFSRHLEVEQLLDRQHEDELVVLEGEVVDPRRVGDRLPPGLRLHVLLEAGVQVADHRAQADDVLAVELDDEPQHAVRRRVVRPEVDLEDVARSRAAPAGPAGSSGSARGCASPRRSSAAPGAIGHYSSPEKRTGSPPIG